MNPDTEWPAATVQYRLNLPHALHSISPTLSALHTSRAAALHPDIEAVLHPSHCPKCGTYHFSGDHHPSYFDRPSAGKKRKRSTSKQPRALHRRCHSCGFSVDPRTIDHSSVPFQHPGGLSKTVTAPVIPQTNETRQELPHGDVSRPTVGTVQTTKSAPIPPLPSQQSHPKPSRAKTSTLKDMLSRDRQRDDGVKSYKKRQEGHEGLAAFLKEL